MKQKLKNTNKISLGDKTTQNNPDTQQRVPLGNITNKTKPTNSQRVNTKEKEKPKPNIISQDSDDDETLEPEISHPEDQWFEDDCPASNTRHRTSTRTLTQECIMAAMEITTTKVNANSAASRKCPMQFLCELAGAVLDSETGEMLE